MGLRRDERHDGDRRLGPRQHRHDQRRRRATPSGRFGVALTFDGVNDLVTVADSASLDLTNRATLEAWVNPAALGDWRTILLKEQPGHLVYALYANNDVEPAQRPRVHERRSVHERHELPCPWTRGRTSR